MIFAPLIEGFTMGGALIMAIGAQNAFVIKQGLKKQFIMLTVVTCFLCDAVLIILGVKGLGLLFDDWPLLELALRWGGVVFLVGYGIRCFISATRPQALMDELESTLQHSRMTTLLTLLAFTLLNPHAYIDALLLLGNVGAQHSPENHLSFIVGALLASFLWFFSLAYGASRLRPLFRNPRAWQVLDVLTGFLMLGIALTLII